MSVRRISALVQPNLTDLGLVAYFTERDRADEVAMRILFRIDLT